MIFNKIKKVASKMKPTPKESLREDESIYHGGAQGVFLRKGKKLYRQSTGHGTFDNENGPGHGMFKDQGLTNYIKHHENDVLEDDKHRRK